MTRTERDLAIWAARETGLRCDEIALRFGLKKRRVSQILAEYAAKIGQPVPPTKTDTARLQRNPDHKSNLPDVPWYDAPGLLGWTFIACRADDQNASWHGQLGALSLKAVLDTIVEQRIECGALTDRPTRLLLDGFHVKRELLHIASTPAVFLADQRAEA